MTYVIEPDADDARRREAEALVESATGSFLEPAGVTTKTLESDDVVDAIVEESAGYDLTVIGATRQGLLQQFVFGAIPEQVGRRANSTVIMAKRDLGITSRLARWFRRRGSNSP